MKTAPRKSASRNASKSTAGLTESKPSRQEQNAQRFLRKQRLARQRAEVVERFPFKPEFSDDVDSANLLRTAKRIQLAEESDNQCGLFSSDLHSGIRAMILCAGSYIDVDVPLDIQFLHAMQKVSDWDLGRTIPTDAEWSRVGTLNYLWAQVVRSLDAIEELNKANRKGFEPSEEWFKSYRRVEKAA